MNDLSPEKDTGTAKSSPKNRPDVACEVAARLIAAKTSARTMSIELVNLMSMGSADWFRPSEMDELRSLFIAAQRLYERTVGLEDLWRARQGLSPKS